MKKHITSLTRRPGAAETETTDPDILFILDVLIGILQFVGFLKGR